MCIRDRYCTIYKSLLSSRNQGRPICLQRIGVAKWRCDCKRIRRSLQEMATRKNRDKCQIPKRTWKTRQVIYKQKRKLQETVLLFCFETPVVIKAVTLHFWINLIKYGYVIKSDIKEWMMIKLKKRLIGTGLVLATGILLSACRQSNTCLLYTSDAADE